VKPKRIWVEEGFLDRASKLRSHFEKIESNVRGSDPRRFCWDFWHVPGQYRLLRTPAYHFFPKSLYQSLHRQLVDWGRKVLGCHAISPPWMSAYIEGCEQRLHADLPHGPWAFVYSLSPWSSSGKAHFKGGETLLLREEILSFWEQESLGARSGLEEAQVFERIAPVMNRLVVFDPRIPHGVSRVEGASDLLEARLVIHGWFVNPRPFIEGRLRERELALSIERVLGALDGLFRESRVRVRGALSVGFRISAGGEAQSLRVLAHSLRSSAESADWPAKVIKQVLSELRSIRFSRSARGSKVTLPLVFE
jgi:2OG-Fe(II) oxygenase superfamily